MDQVAVFPSGTAPESRREIAIAGMKLSLVYWLVLLTVQTLLAMIGGWETWLSLDGRVIMTGFAIGASGLIIRLVIRLEDSPFTVRALCTCAAVVAVASVHYVLPYYLFRVGDRSITPPVLVDTLRGILFWVCAYLGWAALFLARHYSAQVQERERQLSILREQAHGAQMRALRYQINPHFLFNTLNALAEMIEDGDAKNAERMVISLSTFLRSTLALDPMQDITLAEELDIQWRYLDVERERHSDRLTVTADIPPELIEARVPSLILQPLIENAVKHGVGALDRRVRIRLSAEAERDRLNIHVDNDAPAVARPSAGTGTGLRNVAQRLATRFGEAGRFSSGRGEDGVFRATISLPLRFSPP